MRPIAVLAACALALAGCTFSKELTHQTTGHRIRCESFGWGFFGTPMAIAMYEQCLHRAQQAGYQ